MSLALIGKGLLLEGLIFKIEDKQVSGIAIIYIHTYTALPKMNCFA